MIGARQEELGPVAADEVLLGVGITLALAVGSQIVASRLRIPALILLLPVGFTAGALTDVVHPDRLLGPAFAPLVMLSVAVILYDAGLGLDLSKLKGHTRRVVLRLIWLGIPITWAITAAVAAPVLGLSLAAAVLLGAILVVSGPTVVGPLLEYVRPTGRLQRVLAWEGTLIDPVGAILAAVTLSVIVATTRPSMQHQVLDLLASAAVGVIGGVVGIALLWFLLRRLDLSEVLGTLAQLAAVVVVATVCDVLRDDSGLLAAILMGLGAANIRALAVSGRRPFLEALVQLILGLLFISISAGVSPDSLSGLVLPTVVLLAALVLVARPLVALVSTIRTDLTTGERAFGGWMAPRGIVAASTASTFSITLVERGIDGAEKILPATFLVIVATVTLYSLTARAVASRLGVVRPASTRPLLVGGDQWVVDLGLALRACGLDVLMWAGSDEERRRISGAGLEIGSGELVAAAVGQGASIEGVNQILLLTREDDFNALASVILRGSVEGPVYRLAPSRPRAGVLAPYLGGEVLFRSGLGRSDVDARCQFGGQITLQRPGDECPPDHDPLFVVRADGRLEPHTVDSSPEPAPGDTIITLSPSTSSRHHVDGARDDQAQDRD